MAILVDNHCDLTIFDNYFSENEYAVACLDGASPTLGYNFFHNNEYSLFCGQSSNPILYYDESSSPNGGFNYFYTTSAVSGCIGVYAGDNSFPIIGTSNRYGYNDFMGNPNAGNLYYIQNANSSGRIMAERNYWNYGITDPNSNQFSGLVDYDPWLEGHLEENISGSGDITHKSGGSSSTAGFNMPLSYLDQLFTQGQEALVEGNYTIALAKFGAILLSNSEDYKLAALSLIAETYRRMDLSDEIIPYLQQIINTSPSAVVDNFASLLMASQYNSQNNVTQCMNILEVIANNTSLPDNLQSSALFNRAEVYLCELHDTTSAIGLLAEYIEDYPEGSLIDLAILRYNVLTGESIQKIGNTENLISYAIPEKYELKPNYPNPFNPTTTITYTLPSACNISLIVYDVSGREIVRLYDGYHSEGTYKAVFEGGNLPSGVYFARFTAGDFTHTQKMLLIK